MAKKKTTSPTQRSLALLRRNGYTAAVVEKWNPHMGIRQDLFGFADLLAFTDGDVLLVQTTTSANMAARVNKIRENESAAKWIAAGYRIVVHGWKKTKAGKWECREEVMEWPN